jgi:hypothetical protein
MTSYPVTPLESLPLLLLRRKHAGLPVAVLSDQDVSPAGLGSGLSETSLVGAGNAAS